MSPVDERRSAALRAIDEWRSAALRAIEAFLAALPSSASADAAPSSANDRATSAAVHDDLAPSLREHFEHGCAAWPGVTLSPTEHARYLGARCGAADPVAGLLRLRGADLYLAAACAAGQREALAAFERAFIDQAPAILSRLRLSADQIDEVQQRVRARLLLPGAGGPPRIVEYAGQGPLGSWVRVVLLREAHSLLRQRAPGQAGAAPEPPELLEALPRDHDQDLRYLKDRYQDAFRQAFQDAVARLSSEERNLLRLYFLDGLQIDQLGALFGVHRATAARRLQSVREKLLYDTRDLLRARLQLRPDEMDSLIRVLRSQLDVSLHSLLRDR